MNEKYLNKNVVVYEKNGTMTKGEILYWVQEQGEKEYILINDKCIYVENIRFIQEEQEDVSED